MTSQPPVHQRETEDLAPPESPARRAWIRLRSHPLAMIAGVYLLLVLLAVLLAPWISPYPPDHLSDAQFQPPSWAHWFGTDVHGRDLLSRLLAGARISLLVGAVGATVSLLLGVTWGSVAGFLGGKWDHWMMRAVDILYSLPSVIFVIVLVTTLEAIIRTQLPPSWDGAHVRLVFLFIGLGAVSWLTMARIVRGQVLSLRKRAFVEAAHSLGLSPSRILWRHLMPNLTGVVIVYTALSIPSIILYESFLSYLGLGIQPPMASWGSLIAEGATYLNPIRIYWWLIVFPTGTMTLTLLALNFFGDGLRDALEES